MFYHDGGKLQYPVRVDAPNPVFAKALQQAIGGGAGGQDRAERAPWLPLALAAKVASDMATNLTLAREEWAENKALCAYCQAANLALLVSLPLVLPEARKALGQLFNR